MPSTIAPKSAATRRTTSAASFPLPDRRTHRRGTSPTMDPAEIDRSTDAGPLGATLAPTIDALLARWAERTDEYRRLGLQADAAKLCDAMRRELMEARAHDEDRTMSLTDASRVCGYSREHLSRLVRDGKIPNLGRPNAPRVRPRDLPWKRTHLPSPRVDAQLTPTSRRQIVRSIVKAREGSR